VGTTAGAVQASSPTVTANISRYRFMALARWFGFSGLRFGRQRTKKNCAT
jgi:hypothetical protein